MIYVIINIIRVDVLGTVGLLYIYDVRKHGDSIAILDRKIARPR